MPKFKELVDAPVGTRVILQGNAAFALGVLHAGFHAADGYPGTPSTEVIDACLSQVQDKIKVGWSVNEAVAVGVAVGHALAGFDVVVTMKIPGLFQAADAVSTSAFYNGPAGALVIYAATDYVPSSTQHVIDARYFLASCRLPVLEPRSHQEMYDVARQAADISRRFQTPVVVLASGILCHSEGLLLTGEQRTVSPRELQENLHQWMLMPGIARKNYEQATGRRIPAIAQWAEGSGLLTETAGNHDFGIIVNGAADMIVREALNGMGLHPAILSLCMTHPLPIDRIKTFAEKVKGKLFVIEEGDKFLEEKLKLAGLPVTGKPENSPLTDWQPEEVSDFLSTHLGLHRPAVGPQVPIKPLPRPPSICPGCPYRAFGLAVDKLKKQKKLYASFGDIGCSSLLYFLNALDTVMCMGASDTMRQGFVLSRPDMAGKTLSVVGDSCECHSGLDATRNAVFRNIPGVKVILDNHITAMTGGQPAPSSPINLAGQPQRFVLKEAVAAEKGRTVVIDAYDLKGVEAAVKEALELGAEGEFTTLILEGPCIQETDRKKKNRTLEIDRDTCKKCGLCGICPGIEHDEEKRPHFTSLCTNCGGNTQVCRQRCPFGAIRPMTPEMKGFAPSPSPSREDLPEVSPAQLQTVSFPPALRLAIRGIGGQGNLFFGKVLAEVALRTPYAQTHIIKGETHGMAQLGGPVISTFACGQVHSPVMAPQSADVLVVMEIGEVLRPGFLDLLKAGGKIIFNEFRALPINARKEDYPDLQEIKKSLSAFDIVTIDANRLAIDLGDQTGRSANVVVLGLLSTTAPFDLIPESTWLAGLDAVTSDPRIRSANRLAFQAGRQSQSAH